MTVITQMVIWGSSVQSSGAALPDVPADAMAERGEETNMDLLVDLRDDCDVDSPGRRPSLKGSLHSDSLLAPDTDFMTDDRSSAASGLDVADRLTYLEQRMQMQEDEIQLLKMALADVLKRLNITEELQANANATAARRVGGKARPVSLALPSRPAMKKSSTAPSAGPMRNYSPTPSSSSVKSPPGSVKDSPKARPGSAASTRKPQEGPKPREASASLGTRRVTHCKDLSEPPRKKDWMF